MALDMGSTVDAVMGAGNGILLDSIMKCQSVFEGHNRALVSISGGGGL